MSSTSGKRTGGAPGLDSPEVAAFFEDLSRRANVIFVTGCARSGTSLLQRCLSTVRDPDYLWSENSLLTLYERGEARGRNVVLKRRSRCHRTLHLIPPSVKVVHIVRHPGRVLTSRVRQKEGYYVSPERWLDETRAYWRMADIRPANRLAIVRYEDLMADPDAVQTRLASDLDIEFDLPFTAYCERNHLDGKIDKFTGERRVWEPIDAGRAGRNRSRGDEVERIGELRPVLEPELSRFCAQFGYHLPG